MRSLAIAALVTCATCGAPERSQPIKPERVEAKADGFPSGVYAITTRRIVSDNCDNRLAFETTVLEIDMVASSVHTAPDDRPYEAVIDRGALVARGAFGPNALCDTYRRLEIWRLERESDTELSGYRTTYFRNNRRTGDCLEACKVVYAVEAVRADDAGEEGGDEASDPKCDPADPLCGL